MSDQHHPLHAIRQLGEAFKTHRHLYVKLMGCTPLRERICPGYEWFQAALFRAIWEGKGVEIGDDSDAGF